MRMRSCESVRGLGGKCYPGCEFEHPDGAKGGREGGYRCLPALISFLLSRCGSSEIRGSHGIPFLSISQCIKIFRLSTEAAWEC